MTGMQQRPVKHPRKQKRAMSKKRWSGPIIPDEAGTCMMHATRKNIQRKHQWQMRHLSYFRTDSRWSTMITPLKWREAIVQGSNPKWTSPEAQRLKNVQNDVSYENWLDLKCLTVVQNAAKPLTITIIDRMIRMTKNYHRHQTHFCSDRKYSTTHARAIFCNANKLLHRTRFHDRLQVLWAPDTLPLVPTVRSNLKLSITTSLMTVTDDGGQKRS